MKTLTWRLLNAVQFTYFFLWTASWVILALTLATVTRRRSLALAIARRIWAPGINYPAGLRIQVEGYDKLAPDTAYYFVANHQSFFDIPVLFGSLPTGLHFIAKAELSRFPFVGWFVSSMGMVFVQRGHLGRGLQAIDQVTELLTAGKSVISFSEGTRGDGKTLRRFKSGGFRAPIAAAVPVVPVAIQGTYAAMPARELRLRPARVTVRIGEPILPGSEGREDRHQLARQAQNAVAALLGSTPSLAASED